MGVYSVNKQTGDLELIAGSTLYADAPVGAIISYGGTVAPGGWLLCQGQAVSRTTYADLFSAIGTAFGSGDGSTTFNVPDLRESVPVGASQSTRSDIATHDVYTIGQFKDDQLQEHRHSLPNDINAAFGETTSAFGGGGGSPFTSTGNISSGRTGTTTHGKQLGVNYIIKAVQSAMPLDIETILSQKTLSVDYENVVTVYESGGLIYNYRYTATKTGYIVVSYDGLGNDVGSTTSLAIFVQTDDDTIYMTNEASISIENCRKSSPLIPVSAGDVFTINLRAFYSGSTAPVSKIKFYPLKYVRV